MLVSLVKPEELAKPLSTFCRFMILPRSSSLPDEEYPNPMPLTSPCSSPSLISSCWVHFDAGRTGSGFSTFAPKTLCCGCGIARVWGRDTIPCPASLTPLSFLVAISSPSWYWGHGALRPEVYTAAEPWLAGVPLPESPFSLLPWWPLSYLLTSCHPLPTSVHPPPELHLPSPRPLYTPSLPSLPTTGIGLPNMYPCAVFSSSSCSWFLCFSASSRPRSLATITSTPPRVDKPLCRQRLSSSARGRLVSSLAAAPSPMASAASCPTSPYRPSRTLIAISLLSLPPPFSFVGPASPFRE